MLGNVDMLWGWGRTAHGISGLGQGALCSLKCHGEKKSLQISVGPFLILTCVITPLSQKKKKVQKLGLAERSTARKPQLEPKMKMI